MKRLKLLKRSKRSRSKRTYWLSMPLLKRQGLESGAGFSVVADEVRSLALRAAEAARLSSKLIENTLKTATDGKGMTKAARGAFEENMELTKKVAQLIDEIAAATNEQSQGIEHVNLALTDMEKIVQHNAVVAEESAIASEVMDASSVELKDIVKEMSFLVNSSVFPADTDTTISTPDRPDHKSLDENSSNAPADSDMLLIPYSENSQKDDHCICSVVNKNYKN